MCNNFRECRLKKVSRVLDFAKSTKIVHSRISTLQVHLEDKSIDIAILRVGVNDFLNDNSQSNVDNLMSNIHKIIEICKLVGVRIFLCPVWCILQG